MSGRNCSGFSPADLAMVIRLSDVNRTYHKFGGISCVAEKH
jgi:hypothetical protein